MLVQPDTRAEYRQGADFIRYREGLDRLARNLSDALTGNQSETFRLFCNILRDFHHITAHNDRQLIVRALFINRQLNLRKIDDMQIDRSAVTCYQLCKIYNLLLCALAGVRRRMEINRVNLDASLCNHKSGNWRIDTAG